MSFVQHNSIRQETDTEITRLWLERGGNDVTRRRRRRPAGCACRCCDLLEMDNVRLLCKKWIEIRTKKGAEKQRQVVHIKVTMMSVIRRILLRHERNWLPKENKETRAKSS